MRVLYLIQPPGSRVTKTPQRKFSSFLKSMIVEFDRDPAIYTEANIVEVREKDATFPEPVVTSIPLSGIAWLTSHTKTVLKSSAREMWLSKPA